MPKVLYQSNDTIILCGSSNLIMNRKLNKATRTGRAIWVILKELAGEGDDILTKSSFFFYIKKTHFLILWRHLLGFLWKAGKEKSRPTAADSTLWRDLLVLMGWTAATELDLLGHAQFSSNQEHSESLKCRKEQRERRESSWFLNEIYALRKKTGF